MSRQLRTKARGGETYNDTVLPNLYVVSDSRRLDDGVRANVDMVPNLHGVVVEVPSVCFIWRPVT